jgi:predicted phage baseplate assembly protein
MANEVWNRPALERIGYRVGTHASFLEAMKARLHSLPGLAPLNTRDPGDFTLALLDATAAVGDVLTFYTERLANGHYLGTAGEPAEIRRLAALVGYEPRPGISANVDLAFTVRTHPGGEATVRVPRGTKVQSTPGDGEAPQVFETFEDLTARPEWNELPGRTTRPPLGLDTADPELFLEGLGLGVKVEDRLVVRHAPDRRTLVLRVVAVVEDVAARRTHVVGEPLALVGSGGFAGAYEVFKLRHRGALYGHNCPPWVLLPEDARKAVLRAAGVSESTLSARAASDVEWPGLSVHDVAAAVEPPSAHAPSPGKKKTTKKKATGRRGGGPLAAPALYLDREYEGVTPHATVTPSWVAVETGGLTKTLTLLEVDAVDACTPGLFGLTTKVTRLWIHGNTAAFDAEVRRATAYVGTEALPVAQVPLPLQVSGAELPVLPGAQLPPGRPVIVTGETAAGEAYALATTVEGMDGDAAAPRVRLARGVAVALRRSTLRIHANVVRATHGDTRPPAPQVLVLGDGKAGVAHQSFTITDGPVSHTTTPEDPRGVSSLEVRVDGVRWAQVDTLYGRGPTEQVYAVRYDDAGRPTITFGDGVHGARPGTGQGNITATYRVGSGPAGRIRAQQARLLMSRPLGVEGALNPLPSTDAGAPETLARAKARAPARIRTLDRVVSLVDYQDFALTHPAVAKALATWTWDGQRRGIFVSIAGEGLAGGDTPADLQRQLQAAGDPFVPVTVMVAVEVPFTLSARVTVRESHRPSDVQAVLRERVLARYAFDAQALGASVLKTDLFALLHEHPGVLSVAISTLSRAGGTAWPLGLEAQLPDAGAGAPAPAELLTLAPEALTLAAEVTS